MPRRAPGMAVELAVRVVVGIVGASLGGFVGLVVGAAIASGIDLPGDGPDYARLAGVAVMAGLGARIAWVGTTDSAWESMLLWLAGSVAAAFAAVVGLIAGNALLDDTDLFRLSTRVMGVAVGCAAVGAGVVPAVVGLVRGEG